MFSLSRSRIYLPMLFFGVVSGCAEISNKLPGGLSGTIETIKTVGGAVANKPSFSDSDEAKMAQQNAKNFEAENKMWEDPLLNAYLTELTQRIVTVSHPRPFSYSIRVVNDGSINAFTFGGGLLYIHAGLLARMDNEAQFAMVLAHEIAHVTERHVTKGIERTYGIQLLGAMAQTAVSASGTTASIPPDLLQKTYDYTMKASVSGHGRSQESEADVVGLDYMVKAGYDPREAPKTFELLLKEYGDQKTVENFFYGDHPTNQSRIEKLNGLIKSKYSQDPADHKLLVNTGEFKQRTRELVVAAAQSDYEARRFHSAAAMFEKALLAKDNDPESHYYLGKIALETGSNPDATKRAIGHFVAAIKANDKFANAYKEMGLAYYKIGDRKTAIQAFEKYLTLNPQAKDADRIRKSIEDLKGT